MADTATQRPTAWPYAEWEDVREAVADSLVNAEGHTSEYYLEYAFQKHGLVVLYHVDMPLDAVANYDRLRAELAEAHAALRRIADGLANTHSTPGQWMTRIRKPDAWRIAVAAIANARAA